MHGRAGQARQLPAQDERRWCWVLVLPAADFAVKAQCCSATLLALPQPPPTFGDLEKTNQIQPTRQLWGGRPAAPYGRRTSGLTISAACLSARPRLWLSCRESRCPRPPGSPGLLTACHLRAALSRRTPRSGPRSTCCTCVLKMVKARGRRLGQPPRLRRTRDCGNVLRQEVLKTACLTTKTP